MIKVRILEFLKQGSATHYDIAEELALHADRVSKYLCKMRRETGVVYVISQYKFSAIGRPCNVWALSDG